MKKLSVLLLMLLAVMAVIAVPVGARDELCVIERTEYLAPQSREEIFDDIVDLEEFADYLRVEFAKFKTEVDIEKFDIPYSMGQDLFNLIDEIVPDCFYVKVSSLSGYRNGAVTTLKVTYLCGKDELGEYQKIWDKTIEAMLYGIVGNSSLSDVQKALLIHDRIALHCEYDSKNLASDTIPPESYTSFGVIIKGIAVCQGYAETYSYLLSLVGIDSYLCSSDDLFHAWNIVYIDGEYYYVDVTWDDTTPDKSGNVRHDNFLCSYSVFKESHDARDYDTTPSDTKYDDYFWKNSTTAFQLVGDEIYYVDNED